MGLVVSEDEKLFLGQLSGRTPTSRAIEAVRGIPIPISGYEEELWLRAQWRFGPSSSHRYLRTEWSEFALLARTKDKPAPFVRLEVEARQDPDAWNVAHLQVHGESQVLGQIWGVTKARVPKQLSKLHLPVGGFQYRPCLEDFIEFLIEEKLVRGKDHWRKAIHETRHEYRMRQLSSLIRKNTDEARRVIAEIEEE